MWTWRFGGLWEPRTGMKSTCWIEAAAMKCIDFQSGFSVFMPCLAAAASLLPAGCAAKSKYEPVTGEVLFQGTPLDRGNILFFREGTQGPTGGAVISNGRFEVSAKSGLTPGRYR